MSSCLRSVGGRNAGLAALRSDGGCLVGDTSEQGWGKEVMHWLLGDLRWQEYPVIFSGDMMMEK